MFLHFTKVNVLIKSSEYRADLEPVHDVPFDTGPKATLYPAEPRARPVTCFDKPLIL